MLRVSRAVFRTVLSGIGHQRAPIRPVSRLFSSIEFEDERDWSVLPQKSVYPLPVRPTESIYNFREKYHKSLESGNRNRSVETVLCGRIVSRRDSSRKLVFLTIEDEKASVQVMASRGDYAGGEKEFDAVFETIRRGDVVAVRGYPGKSGRGELSVFPHSIVLLAPCLRNIPEPYSLEDPQTRARKRFLDMMVNREKTRGVFDVRWRVLQGLRQALWDRDFTEVETPILSSSSGGALALPFTTHSQSLNRDLRLRVAPELFLKQCIVAGYDRVFELGKVFRNEGVDMSHSPEFTSCELYAAHTTLDDLMTMTEEILDRVAVHAVGTNILELPSEHVHRNIPSFETKDETVSINFSSKTPWRRIDIPSGLSEAIGQPFPDCDAPDARDKLFAILRSHNIDPPTPATPARMVDALIAHFLEPQCIQPTFLTGHPAILSPLARRNDDDPSKCDRFELFVAGKELCNAYQELTDPAEQADRFASQAAARDASGRKDPEAHAADEAFLEALAHGLPPTGGWGLGVDRLVMLLSNRSHIRDVLLFPVLRDN